MTFTFIAVGLGGIALVIFTNYQSTAGTSDANFAAALASVAPVQPEAAPLPPPVFQLAGVLWNKTGRIAEAPLTIRTAIGVNYYVKLVDAVTGAPAMAIFVEGGQTIDVEVPIGSYRFHYATGATWRGEAALFGPGILTSYNEAGDRFDFTAQGDYINGYTVELINQVNGNLENRVIDPASF